MKVENLDVAKELQKDLEQVDDYIKTVKSANCIELKLGSNSGVSISDTNIKPNQFARILIEMNKSIFLQRLEKERAEVIEKIEAL